MKLTLEYDLLKKVMHNFYTVTNIRSSVYDGNYVKIMAYPEQHSKFCEFMHNNPTTRQNCIKSNVTAFKECKKNESLVIYTCHAGLTEVVAPLKDNHVIIGYIVFGQITTIEDTALHMQTLKTLCQQYGLYSLDCTELITDIQYHSEEKIQALAQLLEASTYYVMYKGIIRLNRNGFLTKLDHYIDQHIADKITIHDLCIEFMMSRTKLYDVINDSLNTSIGRYITVKRIEHAKKLLVETDSTITEIAELTGFTEYNYFCSVFKKEVGITANQYRFDNLTPTINTDRPMQ